jgi:NADH dehydrogenase
MVVVGKTAPIHRVFVTGATGFVGRSVIHALRTEGYVVRCLVRRGSEGDLHGFGAIERVEGDVLQPETLEPAMTGCDTAIHLVGIIREMPARGVTFERVHLDGTVNVLAAATATGVRRFLHMSALGTRAGARSRYHLTKLAAEDAVRASALPWTIFRPSVIYGRGDGFVSMLAGMVRRLPVVPVIGDGRHRLQPVPVEQVADGFARAVEQPASVKQIYEIGGADAVTMNELLQMIGTVLGRERVRRAHVPIGLMRVMASLFHRLPSFPLTPDQLRMLEENNTCDATPFLTTFGFTPAPLAAGLHRMLD